MCLINFFIIVKGKRKKIKPEILNNYVKRIEFDETVKCLEELINIIIPVTV